jgi:hypothetical protein
MFLMNPNLKEAMEATNIVGSQADRYCDQESSQNHAGLYGSTNA